MPNKSIGIIYKIQHKERTDTPVYFGSTTNLEERIKQHRYNCINSKYYKHNYYVYQFIRDYDGWDSWKVVKLSEVLFSDIKELKQLEKIYIKNYLNEGKKCLNRTMPNRSKKEWRKDNPEKVQVILQRNRLKHREKANEWRRNHYYENKERIIKQNKEYYEKNKEKINKNRCRKWNCICGAEISFRHRADHLKSKLHHEKSMCILAEGVNKIL